MLRDARLQSPTKTSQLQCLGVKRFLVEIERGIEFYLLESHRGDLHRIRRPDSKLLHNFRFFRLHLKMSPGGKNRACEKVT